MREINQFAICNELPAAMHQRLVAYADAHWSMRKGMDAEAVLRGFPRCARSDVMMLLYSDLLKAVPLFVGSPPGFIEDCACAFEPNIYLQGDYLMQKGEVGGEMMFIRLGSVIVVDDDTVLRALPPWERIKAAGTEGNDASELQFVSVVDFCLSASLNPKLNLPAVAGCVVAIRGEKEFIGEGALVDGKRRSMSILARSTFCHTLHITRSSFNYILPHYPSIQKRITRIHRTRETSIRPSLRSTPTDVYTVKKS